MRQVFQLGVGALAAILIAGCSDDVRTVVRTAPPATSPTDTPAPTASAMPTETASVTPTTISSPTIVISPTVDPSPPPSGTRSPTATPTGTPAGTAAGPIISYFGIIAADDRLVASAGTDGAGRPIYERELGTGLSIVVEARSGLDGRPAGREAFELEGLPDLQMLVSRPLGDGSRAVCDVDLEGPNGGVPAVDPPVYSNDPATIDAINDLGCRVNDGTGLPVARNAGEACTRSESGQFEFAEPRSQLQFCLPIARAWAFPQGDTIVTARVRSVFGSLGNPQQIVVRIARALTPLPTVPAGTPRPTPTPVPPQITYFGIAAADDAVVLPDGVDDAGRDVYPRLIGHAFSLVIEAAPSRGGRPVGMNAFSGDGLEPDLRLLVSRDLGDGNPEVCDVDITNEIFGGVPGFDPPEFTGSEAVVDAINDLGCRVNDGTGAPLGRNIQSPCTRDRLGNFVFIDPRSTVQFCLPIARAWQYQPGETVTAAQVRSIDGGLSPVEEIVIRVEGDGREDCEDTGPGARTFSIHPDTSEFLVAGFEGNLSSQWVAEPAQLCAGPDETGVHPLRLLRDFSAGLRAADGSVLCARFSAAGSEGILDCVGAEPHGVRFAIDSDDDQIDLQIGLGDPAGPGAAILSLPVGFLRLTAPAEPADCLTARIDNRMDMALTTGQAEAEVIHPLQGGAVAIRMTGQNFDCARWRSENSPGRFILPLASTFESEVGDTASLFVLDD